MLDVHVLLSPDTRADWQRQCLTSLTLAIGRAGYPVTLHKIDAVAGHIGQGRAKGYACGDHPWVACVDDDDVVFPDALANLAQGFRDGVAAVSTLEVEMRNNAFRIGTKRHHLSAFRRERIIDHMPWKCCGDVAQVQAIADHEWHDVATPGYLWRVYEGSAARDMRLSNPDELRRARGE